MRAIGKPVALEASADERDTRGFISMITHSPVSGWTANWTLAPPVSTPTVAQAGRGGVAQHLVLLVGERQRRRHRDRVAGVHAHRVEVLDRAHHDHGVGAVAHHLELVLLPALDRALDQHLADRARRRARPDRFAVLVAVVDDRRAGAAERERRPQDRREADDVGGAPVGGASERDRHATAAPAARRGASPRGSARGPRRVRIASTRGAEQLDAEAIEHAGVGQLDRHVERGLAAERGQQRVAAARARGSPPRRRR